MWEKYFGCSLDFYRQLHERERRNKISFANESVRVGGKVTDAVLDEENILQTVSIYSYYCYKLRETKMGKGPRPNQS